MAKRKISGSKKCAIYRETCPQHHFVHGAEAEELRQGIEEVISKIRDLQEDEEDSISALRDFPETISRQLQKLLDKTDARDSFAFLEAKEE